jgi:tetratricopeptide (TPR) repeat protein
VGDAVAEAESLRGLGLLSWNVGRLEEARGRLQEALDIGVGLDISWYIARYQNNLGIVLLQLGEHTRAGDLFRESLARFISTKDSRGEAQALNNLGDLHLHRGETDLAHTAYSRAFDIFSAVGSRSEIAIGQLNRGNTLPVPERLDDALALHRQALATFRYITDKRNETATLNAIGSALFRSGRYVEASAHHAAALALARVIGASQEEAQALCGIGLTELRAGRGAVATEKLTLALATARKIGASEEEAHALVGLAEVQLTTGRTHEALPNLQLAYAKLISLNKIAAEQVRQRIAGIRQT